MKGACHCGALAVEVPGPPPFLNQCNCTACWKLGTLWGYYPAEALAIMGEGGAYRRDDRETPTIQFNFCAKCSAVTHWSATEHGPYPLRGVNMRLFDPAELVGVEVRYGDRRNHDAREPRHDARPTSRFGAGGAEL